MSNLSGCSIQSGEMFKMQNYKGKQGDVFLHFPKFLILISRENQYVPKFLGSCELSLYKYPTLRAVSLFVVESG